MARTYSNMLPLGTHAPNFTLPNTLDDQLSSLDDIRGSQATLIMFICNHCPFVKHMQKELGELSTYLSQGLGIAAISANDATSYPEDSPVHMSTFAHSNGFKFPYLYDESQDIAKAYQASCTPDFFLFDSAMQCVYRGRFDESSPGNGIAPSGGELIAAIEAVLAGRVPSAEQHPSLGCNIKWKAA